MSENGFAVTTIKSPGRQELLSGIDYFIGEHGYDPENRLLICFAGHGHTLKQAYGGEMGYIIPGDAPDPTMDRPGFLRKAIDMPQIEVYARRIQSKREIYPIGVNLRNWKF